MKKEIDEVLKHALTPTDEPDFWLNQRILIQVKEKNGMEKSKLKRIPALVLSTALVLGVGSVTAFAAWKYLAPESVAEKMYEPKLADAFLGNNAVTVNETQSYGGYDVTLMGIVSGKNLLENHLKVSNGHISLDKTYSVVAIENSDGMPFPDTSEDAYGDLSFFVSPLIQGYDPLDYNAVTMYGGYQDIVEDGILYRIAECDNVEMFADHKLYLCVSDGSFYNAKAYLYNKETGEISRNEAYTGLNALFDLPLDASKADPVAAEEYIRSLSSDESSENETTESTGFSSSGNSEEDESVSKMRDLDQEIKQWMDQLTPENISEYAECVESTVQTLTPDADGYVHYEYEIEGRGGGSGSILVSWYFRDKTPGMQDTFGYSYSEDGFEDLKIETFTLNEDGTVTFAAYIPKEF